MSGAGRDVATTSREIVSARRVQERIGEIATQIARDFRGRKVLWIVIAEGARRFAAALAERATGGVPTDLLEIRARRTEGTRLREVRVEAFEERRCAGRDVLVVDDIADEGRTLAAVIGRVEAAGAASIRTAVLVSKHARRQVELALDYVGFDVDDGWVVGFGMDVDGKLRELDALCVVDR